MSSHPKRRKLANMLSDLPRSSRSTIFEHYPRNATYPADPSLVPKEQRQITETIQSEVLKNVPDDFSDSMRDLVRLAQLSTDLMLAAENQSSYNEIKPHAKKHDRTIQDVLVKYAKGMAVGSEVLLLMTATGMKTAGLIMRTHAFEQKPHDLKADIQQLYQEMIAQQQPHDIMSSFNERTRVKMLDREPGLGGLEAVLISKKADIGTILGRSIIVTMRERYIVDVRKIPMKWRSALRKLAATRLHDMVQDEGIDDRSRAELFEALLDCPNPDNPRQTLRHIGEDAPFIHPFSTTIYAASADLTNALDGIEDEPDYPSQSVDGFHLG